MPPHVFCIFIVWPDDQKSAPSTWILPQPNTTGITPDQQYLPGHREQAHQQPIGQQRWQGPPKNWQGGLHAQQPHFWAWLRPLVPPMNLVALLLRPSDLPMSTDQHEM